MTTCQHIKDEPTADDSCKCGKPTVPGLSPYCAEHMKLCWIGHEWRGSDRPAPRPELRSDFR